VAYAVQPTHELKIVFEVYEENKDWPNRGISIKYFRLIKENEKWHFVLECPGPGYPAFLKLKEKHENSRNDT